MGGYDDAIDSGERRVQDRRHFLATTWPAVAAEVTASLEAAAGALRARGYDAEVAEDRTAPGGVALRLRHRTATDDPGDGDDGDDGNGNGRAALRVHPVGRTQRIRVAWELPAGHGGELVRPAAAHDTEALDRIATRWISDAIYWLDAVADEGG